MAPRAAPADEGVVNLLVPSQRGAFLVAHALYARYDGFAPSELAHLGVRGDYVRIGGLVRSNPVAEHSFHDALSLAGLAVGAPRVDRGVVRLRVRRLPRVPHAHENLLRILRRAHVAQRGEQGRVRLDRRPVSVGEEVLELAPDILGIGRFPAAVALAAHGGELLRGDVHGEAAASPGALLARVRRRTRLTLIVPGPVDRNRTRR
mmetsp:Transcript_3803/g.17537  ORF Transcript_3803/g.17537 Transcript_3803/m.17537 type:complete len:205 (-) Transcript_3803:159-773(-)